MSGLSVFLGELTRDELKESIAGGVVKGAIVPLGSCEQHADHLPMIHDTASVTEIARRVALAFRPRVLVTPTISMSISEHHMEHGGALTIRPRVVVEYLYDVCHSLKRLGVPKVMVLNGHGGNNRAKLESEAPETVRRMDELDVVYLTYWQPCPASFYEEHLQVDRSAGHAGEFETSVALALFPGQVRRERIGTGGAEIATMWKGGEIVATVVECVSERVAEMLDEK